jgi:hypothetical protein
MFQVVAEQKMPKALMTIDFRPAFPARQSGGLKLAVLAVQRSSFSVIPIISASSS